MLLDPQDLVGLVALVDLQEQEALAPLALVDPLGQARQDLVVHLALVAPLELTLLALRGLAAHRGLLE